MSRIRILSKKTFAIGPGASKDGRSIDQFVTVRGAIQEIDEKYANDLTFKKAVEAGDIVIMNPSVGIPSAKEFIESKAVEEPVEETPKEVVEEKPEEDNETKVEEFKNKLKTMKADEVEEMATKYGAIFSKDDKLSINKKRVLEAYKLTLSEE